MDKNIPFAAQSAAIFGEAWRLILASPLAVLLYLALMIGGAMLVDTNDWGEGADFAILAVDIGATFALTMILIVEAVPGGRMGSRGFGTYFGLSFLTGIAIGAGFLLLIVPGLYLWARWAPAYGFALAEDMDVSTAMGESWDATRGHVVPILLAMLVPAAVSMAGALAFLLVIDEYAAVSWPLALGGNALVYLGSVLSTAVGMAVFSLLARSGGATAEVFE